MVSTETASSAAPPRSFAGLGLARECLSVLEQLGFHTPTDIQRELIPHALRGADCLGQAKTGTGKTAAFALPMLQRRFSALTASVILGLIWGVWHLPSFFISGMSQNAYSIPAFIAGSVVLAILMTVVYNGTGGSVLLAFLILALGAWLWFWPVPTPLPLRLLEACGAQQDPPSGPESPVSLGPETRPAIGPPVRSST